MTRLIMFRNVTHNSMSHFIQPPYLNQFTLVHSFCLQHLHLLNWLVYAWLSDDIFKTIQNGNETFAAMNKYCKCFPCTLLIHLVWNACKMQIIKCSCTLPRSRHLVVPEGGFNYFVYFYRMYRSLGCLFRQKINFGLNYSKITITPRF